MALKLLLFIFVIGISFSNGQYNSYTLSPPSSSCPIKESIPLNDKCILIEDIENNWQEANWYCNSLGLQLLEIKSGSCYFDIVTHLKNRGLSYFSYWTNGKKDLYRHPQWIWVKSGLSIHDVFWSPLNSVKRLKEPVDDYNKNCALMDGSKNHFLAATQCEERHRFICQGPITVNSYPWKQTGPKPVEPYYPERPSRPVPVKPYYPEKTSGQSPFGPQTFGSKPRFAFGAVFFSENSTEPATDAKMPDDRKYCPEGWMSWAEGNSCYKLYTIPKPYEDAEESCKQDEKGSLAVITSDEENDFVAAYLPRKSGYVWMGEEEEEEKESKKYSNWWSPEKDLCPAIDSSGVWIKEDCKQEKGYICEKPTY